MQDHSTNRLNKLELEPQPMKPSTGTAPSRLAVHLLIPTLSLLCLCGTACSRLHKDKKSEIKHDPDLVKPNPAYAELKPGLWYAKVERTQPPLIYHVIKCDLRVANCTVGGIRPAPQTPKGLATVAEMMQAPCVGDRLAVAAINGDYFANGRDGPWGVQVEQGRLLYSPSGRAAFLVDPDGHAFVGRPALQLQLQLGAETEWRDIADMNRPKDGENPGCHLYADTGAFEELPVPAIGATVDAPLPLVGGVVTGKIIQVLQPGKTAPIPEKGLVLAWSQPADKLPSAAELRPDTPVRIRAILTPHAFDAVGGGPQIVREGKPQLDLQADGVCAAEAAYLKRPHPRAVAGTSRDGFTILFVLAQGRSDTSKGLDLHETADLLAGLGAWEAVMFDGGDSASLYADGDYRARGRGGPRAMCNGLALFTTTK